MDNQMDIMLKAEFKIDIPGIAHGYMNAADANTSHWTVGNYRDIAEVEEATEWIKSVLTSKRIIDPTVTFSTWYSYAEHSYFRVIREAAGYRLIRWDDRGRPKEDIRTAKYPGKEIKKMYLELADIVIEKNNEIQAAS